MSLMVTRMYLSSCEALGWSDGLALLYLCLTSVWLTTSSLWVGGCAHTCTIVAGYFAMPRTPESDGLDLNSSSRLHLIELQLPFVNRAQQKHPIKPIGCKVCDHVN